MARISTCCRRVFSACATLGGSVRRQRIGGNAFTRCWTGNQQLAPAARCARVSPRARKTGCAGRLAPRSRSDTMMVAVGFSPRNVSLKLDELRPENSCITDRHPKAALATNPRLSTDHVEERPKFCSRRSVFRGLHNYRSAGFQSGMISWDFSASVAACAGRCAWPCVLRSAACPCLCGRARAHRGFFGSIRPFSGASAG